jgi:hypothetical protein
MGCVTGILVGCGIHSPENFVQRWVGIFFLALLLSCVRIKGVCLSRMKFSSRSRFALASPFNTRIRSSPVYFYSGSNLSITDARKQIELWMCFRDHEKSRCECYPHTSFHRLTSKFTMSSE